MPIMIQIPDPDPQHCFTGPVLSRKRSLFFDMAGFFCCRHVIVIIERLFIGGCLIF